MITYLGIGFRGVGFRVLVSGGIGEIYDARVLGPCLFKCCQESKVLPKP